jgi:hypothetical protein
MLQGSSSAPPIHNLCSDICLNAYHKMATGASFPHPTANVCSHECAIQYVEDKTEMLTENNIADNQSLFSMVERDTKIWSEMLRLSGRNLNWDKCFYYYLDPTFNYSNGSIRYKTNNESQISIKNPANSKSHILTRLHPQTARRTLRVLLAPNGDARDQFNICF